MVERSQIARQRGGPDLGAGARRRRTAKLTAQSLVLEQPRQSRRDLAVVARVAKQAGFARNDRVAAPPSLPATAGAPYQAAST